MSYQKWKFVHCITRISSAQFCWRLHAIRTPWLWAFNQHYMCLREILLWCACTGLKLHCPIKRGDKLHSFHTKFTNILFRVRFVFLIHVTRISTCTAYTICRYEFAMFVTAWIMPKICYSNGHSEVVKEVRMWNILPT